MTIRKRLTSLLAMLLIVVMIVPLATVPAQAAGSMDPIEVAGSAGGSGKTQEEIDEFRENANKPMALIN